MGMLVKNFAVSFSPGFKDQRLKVLVTTSMATSISTTHGAGFMSLLPHASPKILSHVVVWDRPRPQLLPFFRTSRGYFTLEYTLANHKSLQHFCYSYHHTIFNKVHLVNGDPGLRPRSSKNVRLVQ